MTSEVQDYTLDYRQGEILYEIHLIDSPGFDDGCDNDAEILSRIANYINTTYKLKQTLAGVLYLHDITKQRMGGVGKRNLRMLEKMVGIDRWSNCTLVTTKWGCTTDPKGEESREQTLRSSQDYFGAMLQNAQQAQMARFDPKSKGCALDIIKPMLGHSFAPELSKQMVDPKGPMLSLGETDAGKVVADNLEKLHKANGEIEKLENAQAILAQRFNEKVFTEYRRRKDKLLQKHRMQRVGRWDMRGAIVGGAVAATVLTMGPGAALIALEPGYEKIASNQRRKERAAIAKLKQDYKQDSVVASKTLGGYNPDWLEDRRVQTMQDLDDGYSLKSHSTTDVSESEYSYIEDDMLKDA